MTIDHGDRDVYQICLDQGHATIQVPSGLTCVSVDDLEYFISGMLRTLRRGAVSRERRRGAMTLQSWEDVDNG